jgi:acetyl-CoA carboxylase biotin carboxyl carrier protein
LTPPVGTPAELDQPLVHALLEAFDRSDWLEMTVTIGNDRLHVSRRGLREQAPEVEEPAAESAAPEAVHTEPTHATPVPLTGMVVESPSVGLFWRSPSPGAPPFVEPGTHVSADDTLAIVEVMKLMNHLVAPAAGTVRAILAENGARVEYGQPLIAIDPDE